jgi:ABC-type polysaccharide/polyol phosphate export permease
MYYLNPMASLVANFREVFYYSDAASPDPFFMLRNLVVCTVLLIGGYLFFMRLSHSFGEEI